MIYNCPDLQIILCLLYHKDICELLVRKGSRFPMLNIIYKSKGYCIYLDCKCSTAKTIWRRCQRQRIQIMNIPVFLRPSSRRLPWVKLMVFWSKFWRFDRDRYAENMHENCKEENVKKKKNPRALSSLLYCWTHILDFSVKSSSRWQQSSIFPRYSIQENIRSLEVKTQNATREQQITANISER